MHKERQNAFQNEFKKKEEEMSSILKLKKPEEINFTDDVYDKPIGNDMERLLAEALASRERELEQIKNTAFTAPQPQPQTDSKGSAGPSPTSQEFMTYKTVVREIEGEKERNIKENEKRVSFGSDLHIIENHENNQNDYEMCENSNENIGENSNENIGENVDENSDISFIFNKLKKIKTRKNEKYENENEYVSSINNNNNYNNHVDENNNTHIIFKMSQDIDKMSEDIKYIKNTLAELADKINKLCDHEK